jgi:uncharacterized protein (TIGR02646 family)
MRLIHKRPEPPELQAWKRNNPHGRYVELDFVVRRSIRQQALQEQFFLCAYCCESIQDIDDHCHNEHVEAQDLNPNRTVDYDNIVACCNTPNQCGSAHGHQPLPLTPLMEECETELRFMVSGRVQGLTPRALTSINVLNLGDNESNNKSLIQKRKALSEALLFRNYLNPDLDAEDDNILELFIDELSNPIGEKMESFTPVVINILKNWLQCRP